MIVAYSRPIAMKIYKRILELRPDWTEKVGIVMTGGNNDPEEWHDTLVVATVTARTRKKTKQPTHFLIRENPALSRPSMVLLEQIRTIDKQRIERYLGRVTRQEMFGINRALLVSLDLNTSSRQ